MTDRLIVAAAIATVCIVIVSTLIAWTGRRMRRAGGTR